MTVSAVIYSDRRSISIQVKRDGSVVVHAPAGMRRAEIDEFVKKHERWIEEKRGLMPKPPRAPEFVYCLGQKYPVEKTDGNAAGIKNGAFVLPGRLDADGQRAAICSYFKAFGKPYMAKKTSFWASVMHLPAPPEPKITGAKTRWGSCGGKGGNRISYSYALLMTDEYCIDYVAVHELSHIKYHNHNDDFYALVQRVLPDYKQREEALRLYERIFAGEGLM